MVAFSYHIGNLQLLRGLAAANRCSFVEFLPHLSTRSCLFQHLGARVLYERSFYLAPNGSLCHSCGWFSALLTSRLFKLLRHSRRPSKKPFKNKCTKNLQKASKPQGSKSLSSLAAMRWLRTYKMGIKMSRRMVICGPATLVVGRPLDIISGSADRPDHDREQEKDSEVETRTFKFQGWRKLWGWRKIHEVEPNFCHFSFSGW